uniref:Uncharacterized protein n=1 Tax=Cacopsylla melanoneura TaxID=428564 RepID=A0A8D9B3M9_9HEMI
MQYLSEFMSGKRRLLIIIKMSNLCQKKVILKTGFLLSQLSVTVRNCTFHLSLRNVNFEKDLEISLPSGSTLIDRTVDVIKQEPQEQGLVLVNYLDELRHICPKMSRKLFLSFSPPSP